ncbi:MAG: hypothetical protein R3291_05350, partial [Thermoplasmata archaeon]|nr:hypothetical protein [Thermoplasmata archaeon]
MADAGKAFGGLCEFCSYEGPFNRKEETGEFVCPQCGQPPRNADRAERQRGTDRLRAADREVAGGRPP